MKHVCELSWEVWEVVTPLLETSAWSLARRKLLGWRTAFVSDINIWDINICCGLSSLWKFGQSVKRITAHEYAHQSPDLYCHQSSSNSTTWCKGKAEILTGWKNKSKHVQSCSDHALDRQVPSSACCAGTLSWKVSIACVLCIDTSQKNWSGFSTHLYAAAATPLVLGRRREENTHRQVPYGKKLEEEKEKCYVHHQHTHMHIIFVAL